MTEPRVVKLLEGVHGTALSVVPPAEPALIGTAPAFVAALDAVDQAARSDAPAMLVGETGTGKDALALRIHLRGPRRHRPFVVVNAGAIAPALLDSELFGHTAGAFTGATRQRRGLVVEADGGTLFLDEIADLPLELQGRLLRVLEHGAIRAVGADHERSVDVRFIGATQRDLEHAVGEGRFREDLYFRLNVLAIHVPSLRERREDIPSLVHYFFQRARSRNPSSPVVAITPAAEAQLLHGDWPGNVRELASVIERLVVFASRATIGVEELAGLVTSGGENGASAPGPDRWSMEEMCTLRILTDRYVEWVLARVGGDKARAAAILGIDLSTLYRRRHRGSNH